MITIEELKKNGIILDPDTSYLSLSKEKRIDTETIKVIADTLKEYPGILSLDLRCSSTGSRKIVIIAKFLKENHTLTFVDLSCNEIGLKGLKAIADTLQWNKTIVRLDLSSNRISPEGAKAIADAFKWNKSIVRLDLFSNRISDEGAEAIADALKVNHTLTSFGLSFNKIGCKGAEAIADALKVNHTLTSINLSFNKIGLKGFKAIADALKWNKTIVDLRLIGNEIEPEGAKAIEESSEVNHTLASIDLGMKELTSIDKGQEEVWKSINTVLTRNYQYVQKIAGFLTEKFILPKKEESSKVFKDFEDSAPSRFKYYQVIDKKLLQKYAEEKLLDNIDTPSGQIISFANLCNAADSFINKHYFALAGVCKTHEGKEDLISSMPEHIREYMLSFMGDHSLWTAEE